jgi:hypothetical protein
MTTCVTNLAALPLHLALGQFCSILLTPFERLSILMSLHLQNKMKTMKNSEKTRKFRSLISPKKSLPKRNQHFLSFPPQLFCSPE